MAIRSYYLYYSSCAEKHKGVRKDLDKCQRSDASDMSDTSDHYSRPVHSEHKVHRYSSTARRMRGSRVPNFSM